MPDGELPGILTLTDLNGKIETREIETVLVVIPDVMGRMLGRHVPGLYFLEQVARFGLSLPSGFFPGSGFPLTGRVDVKSLRQAPWLNRAAVAFCDVQPAGADAPRWSAPRELLAKQLSAAAAMGLQVHVSASIDYFLFNESVAMLRSRNFSRPVAIDAQQIPGDLSQASYAELANDTARRLLAQAGIEIASTQATGVPGQYRVALPQGEALAAADSLMLVKHCVRSVAGQTGAGATFMALPLSEYPGNELALKLSLWDRGGRRNVFSGELQAIHRQADVGETPELYPDLEPETQVEVAADDGPDDGLDLRGDELARFLSGCRVHLGDMMPLFAPTVNSLKRLQREARPGGVCDELLVAVEDDPQVGSYLSCSLAGADANVYLALAALLAAGLDGLRRDSSGEAEPLVLMDTPETALRAMQSSDFVNGLFGTATIAMMNETWTAEHHLFRQAVTDWERARYFEHA